jgi:hypothetical protein
LRDKSKTPASKEKAGGRYKFKGDGQSNGDGQVREAHPAMAGWAPQQRSRHKLSVRRVDRR